MSGLLDLATFVIRPTALLLLAAGLAAALTKASAAARHLVWTVALIGALLVPLAAVALPDLSVPAPRVLVPTPSPVGAPAAPSVAPLTTETAIDGVAVPGITPAQRLLGGLGWAWLAGALGLVVVLVLHAIRLRRWERQCEDVADRDLVSMLDDARIRLGVARPVRLLLGPRDAMPMTWGSRAPRIVLPRDVGAWPREQARAIILHELAHVRRRDVIVHGVAEIARAVYWFNPVVWFAARRLLVERERACDDEVILAGVAPSDYAHQLLEMTHALRAARATARASISMARPSEITGRLLAVLDPSRTRWTRSARGVAVATLLGIGVVGIASVLQPTAAASTAAASPDVVSPAPSSPALDSGVPRVRPPQAPAVIPVPVSLASGCWDAIDGGTSSSVNSNDGRQTAEWRTSRCRGSLAFDAPPVVDPDTTRFVRVFGALRISESEGATTRVIRAVGRAGGPPTVSGTLDGQEAVRSEVERWIAATLRPLIRFTGVAVVVQDDR